MNLLASGFWFGLVGLGAAATHAAVFGLVQPVMWPELANAFGFGAGFLVSFTGHRRLSFRDTTTSVQQSLVRFLLVAALGFLSNEAVFILLLRWTRQSPWVALVGGMAVAAGQTFLLGRFWAFRR